MNKEKREMLDKCIKMTYPFEDELPIFGGIYIIPTKYKHDSGFKIMYIVGHTPRENGKDEKLYLIDTICDVVDFNSYLDNTPIQDLHIDMTVGGILHIWSFTQNIKVWYAGSNCNLRMVNKYE